MKILKKYPIQLLVLFALISLRIFAPSLGKNSFQVIFGFLKEMLLILPPVFLLMGLIEAWISQDQIVKWLGQESGIKGALLSILLGSLPTGPLYAAFPMASSLMNKGASIRNTVLFLSSWAALKIPHMLMESSFLSPAFTALRVIFTLIFILLLSIFMEVAMKEPSMQKE